MRQTLALAALSFSSALALSAASRIDDPKNFVTEVYGRFVAAQSKHSSYLPPADIYTGPPPQGFMNRATVLLKDRYHLTESEDFTGVRALLYERISNGSGD